MTWPRLSVVLQHNLLVRRTESTVPFSPPPLFKNCVAITMCLILALFSPFLLKYMLVALSCLWVVYSQCKITQLEKQDNRKCIFATDEILEQNSIRRALNVLLR